MSLFSLINIYQPLSTGDSIMNDKRFLGCSCVHVSSNGCEKHYVCNCSMLIDGQVFTDVGEGTSLDIAKQNSMHNLGKLVDGNNVDANITNRPDTLSRTINNAKDRFHGGGNKPMSANQRNLICDKARKQYKNPETLAMEFAGKRFDRLTGSEANLIIKNLLGDQA